MKIICNQCKAVYNIAENRLPKKTKSAKCVKCQGKIKVIGREELKSKPLNTVLNCYLYHGDKILPNKVNYQFCKKSLTQQKAETRKLYFSLTFISGLLVGWLLGLVFLVFIISSNY